MGRACPPGRFGRNAGPQPHSLRSRGPVRDTRLRSCRGPPGHAGPLGDVSLPPWARWGPSCRRCPHHRGLGGSRPLDSPASVQAWSPRPEASAVLPGPPSLLALLCRAPPERSARSGAGHPNPLLTWVPAPRAPPAPVSTGRAPQPPHNPGEAQCWPSWSGAGDREPQRQGHLCSALNDPCQGLLPGFNYHPGFTSPGAPHDSVTRASWLRLPRPPLSPL